MLIDSKSRFVLIYIAANFEHERKAIFPRTFFSIQALVHKQVKNKQNKTKTKTPHTTD